MAPATPSTAPAATASAQLSPEQKVLALIEAGVPENTLTLRATDQGKAFDASLPRQLGQRPPPPRRVNRTRPPRVPTHDMRFPPTALLCISRPPKGTASN